MEITKNTNPGKNGFGLIEGLAVVAILAIIALGAYTIATRPKTETGKPSAPETGFDTSPATSPPTNTPLPTLPPLEENTSDQTINQTSKEINELMGEVNDLDQIEAALEMPEVDFSTDF